MANKTEGKDTYKNEPVGSAESAGGWAETQAGKRGDPPAGVRVESPPAVSLERRTDHTPPPILIESGSVTIETDEELTNRDDTGGQGHPRRHKLGANRAIKGIRVLKVTGESIYEDDRADGSEVKIWWNKNQSDPQILIGGGRLDINTDLDLGAAAAITHPPVTPNVQRKFLYTHPTAGNRGIQKVQIVKSSQAISFGDEVWVVLIWDTSHVA